ncbi:MAG: response regulator [Sphingomonas phyllosphaerae]
MDSVSGTGQPRSLSILLVDDNPAVARALEIAFSIAGHRLDTAVTPADACSRLAERRVDAILLDMNFTPGRSDGDEGLACLSRLLADDPGACVVVITAHSGIRIAVAAMQAGARDFVMKPWRNAELIAKVEAAVARGRVASRAASAVSPMAPVRLLGESAAIERLRAQVRRFGPSGAGVAVTGASGSGRMLTALALHAASGDADAPLRIDVRDGEAWARLDTRPATVILRHVDLLDPVAQARLLDRLPAATRCIAIVDSAALLSPALRRRIATVDIAVPPLSARDGDAVLLARHFARLAAERFGRPGMALSNAAEAAIAATYWPDEVRGLALAVERAVLLSEGETIDAAALALPETAAAIAADTFDLDDAERTMIEAALRRHRHNVSHAAAALGLSRGALYRRMARYGL